MKLRLFGDLETLAQLETSWICFRVLPPSKAEKMKLRFVPPNLVYSSTKDTKGFLLFRMCQGKTFIDK